MELNLDQKELLNQLLNFLKTPKKFYLLTGLAGTGKTFLISYFLSQPELANKKIAVTGCTNKAVGVLESSFRRVKHFNFNQNKDKDQESDEDEDDQKQSKKKEEIIDMTFLTIHKLLQIKRKIDLNGQEVFESNIDENNIKIKSKSIFYYDIIIVDEVSMLNKDLTLQLLRLKDKIKGKIIFLGDRAQLPPVKESESYIFELAKTKIPHGNLTKIMRSGNQLIKFVNSIRKLIDDPKHKVPFNKLAKAIEQQETKITLFRDQTSWIEKYIKLAKEGHNEQIILCYTNKKVDILNRKIRKELFGSVGDDYVAGEKIIFNNAYHLPTNQNNYDSSQMVCIKTSALNEVKIRKLNFYDLINIRFPVSALNINSTRLRKKYKVPDLALQTETLERSGIVLSDKLCQSCYDSCSEMKIKDTCKHRYCKKCYQKWVKEIKGCPLCFVSVQNGKVQFKDDPMLDQMLEDLRNQTKNYKFKTWLLILESGDSLHVIHPDDVEKHAQIVEIIKKDLREIKNHVQERHKNNVWSHIIQQLWDFYYFYFIDQFAQINYGNAITTHRSQGSTYFRVYVDLKDIIKFNNVQKEGFQCLYTAVTRASHYLEILY